MGLHSWNGVASLNPFGQSIESYWRGRDPAVMGGSWGHNLIASMSKEQSNMTETAVLWAMRPEPVRDSRSIRRIYRVARFAARRARS